MKVKLLHQIRDVVDSWDSNPFQEVEESYIDEANHTIRNVCVFGTRHSKNGYDYENPAIDKLAVLTDGAKFFINHPSKSETKDRDGVRDIRDWAGKFVAPRKEGQDKVFADLNVRPAFWELVRDVAVMKPLGIGNSINSRVKVFKDQAGKEHIVDIDTLKSIDLVASAATTQNLFESHLEDMEMDVEKNIDQILEEKEEKQQGDLVYRLIADVAEGLLADKIKEREIGRKVSELNWKASDAIDDILRDKAKDMKAKKQEITSVLDDLESMINDVLAGKKAATENFKEENDMDFEKLTLDELMKTRPDIVKTIQDSIKNTAEMETIRREHGEFKTRIEAMTQEIAGLKTNLEAVTKERDELKVKGDEYELKDKSAKKEALIEAKIAEMEVPKDAISDVFRTTLKGMAEDKIEEALKDRKETYLKGQKTVHGAGEEYNMNTDEGKKTFEEKQKKTSDALEQAAGR